MAESLQGGTGYTVIAAEMKKLCTLGVGGICREAVFPKSAEDFIAATKERPYAPIFGNGSHIVVSDNGIQTAIFTAKVNRIFADGNKVFAECGVKIASLSAFALRNGLGGLEMLSGIPGSVGGAIKMNAGAFGSEISDYLISANIVVNGKIIRFGKSELKFGYRDSAVKKLGNVISAEFILPPSKDGIQKTRSAVLLRSSQPKGKSCGSFFKRVDGISAGYYIDNAGLKGKKIGGAFVSPIHAAFIINDGTATAKDVYTLAQMVKKRVFEVFGITLEEEVEFYGKF